MKTNFNKLLIIIPVIALLAGCDSDLKEEAFSQASPNVFFNSKGDVDAALNGMYDPIQRCCGGYSQQRSMVLNTVSDEGDMTWSNRGNYDELLFDATSNSDHISMWNSNYSSINAANFVLDNAEKIEDLDDTSGGSFAKSALGEAAFWRGIVYFDNVRLWGPVPLRVTVAKSADELNIPRSPEAEVYQQIIEDLVFASENLPPTPRQIGRPSSWSAKSYLAKVHLTMGNFDLALNVARDVVNNGPYNLLTSFADIFDVNNENNAEVIFDIQYVRVNGEGSRMAWLATGNNTQFANSGRGGVGLQHVEAGFFEKFNVGDDRRATTFASLEPHPDNGLYYYGKWRDPQGVSVDGHENNFITLRFADIVLILAEAANEVNGPNAEAYEAINRVRNRALLPDLPIGLTKDEFRDAVIFERHLELALEQHRWFDLKRTGKLQGVLTSTGRPWNSRFLLFPIGPDELNFSDALEQNPGY